MFFGFELEGFYRESGEITLPPSSYTTDGFPGLCEVRTSGADDINSSYFELLQRFMNTPFDTTTFEHVFSPADKRKIRARHNEKTSVNIENIYGKEPKQLGNRTLASFQINLSRRTRYSYVDKEGVTHPHEYGLFDFVPIIRRLDKEFSEEIKEAKRQPGFYAVKDGVRVEYRSLPNTVFKTNLPDIPELLRRIQKCVYNS